MNKKFNNWLDTFLSEKGIDLDQPINVEGESGLNFMTVENIVEFMKVTSAGEQKAIKNTFVMIDFKNGDVLHFIKHLAQGVAQ
jgi:hypothetical protein|tara:strand:- start:255 stop:503 length:249 start_codon:yes stop_codon:yes gene_type:complete